MRRRTYARVLAAGVSCVAGLVLAEGLVRLVAPQYSDQWKMYRVDPVYGRGLRANVRGAVVRGHSGEFAFTFRTNAQGLRMDREVPPRAAPGYRRVLCVGDSFTFGYGVNQGEAFADRLRERLAGANVPVEVINGGFAGGFTTDTEYVFARDAAVQWHADMVLVGVCLSNDLTDLDQTRWHVANGRLAAVRRRTDWVPRWVKRSGMVTLLVRGALPRARAWHAGPGREHTAGPPAEVFGPVCDLPVPTPGTRAAGAAAGEARTLSQADVEGWSREQRAGWLVRAWAAHARRADYELVLLLIPDADEVQWRSSPERLAYRAEVRRVFVAAAAAGGVRVVDPVGALRAQWCATGRELYFREDGHWTAAGHRFVGAWLARELFGVEGDAE